jgi:hypothetical protein
MNLIARRVSKHSERPGWPRSRLAAVVAAVVVAGVARGEMAAAPAANLTVVPGVAPGAADALLDPNAVGWRQLGVRRVSLNRTPPLYDTDPPAELEVVQVEVRAARGGDRLLVRLAWRDATEDAARIAAPPATPPERRRTKEHSGESDRFFDAAAVMFPSDLSTGPTSPSLQMGDAAHPVTIFYWNAARGPMLMKAAGRGTTARTGEAFPARAVHRLGEWRLVLELPDLPRGVPLAFAVWNGSQQDRDGRKAFSLWYRLE